MTSIEPGGPSGHVDSFTRDNLPPREARTACDYAVLPALAAYPDRFNGAATLLGDRIAAGELRNMASVIVGSRKWPSRDRSGSVSRLPWATGH